MTRVSVARGARGVSWSWTGPPGPPHSHGIAGSYAADGCAVRVDLPAHKGIVRLNFEAGGPSPTSISVANWGTMLEGVQVQGVEDDAVAEKRLNNGTLWLRLSAEASAALADGGFVNLIDAYR